MARERERRAPSAARHRRWRLVVLLAASIAVVAGTAADAQLGDPGETTGVDTDFTPRAKASERWEWAAGARYGADGPAHSDVPAESVTPFELDFFDVAFHDASNGFAGGAECAESVDPQAPDATAQVRACERVPVIYQYSVDEIGEGSWREVFRGEGRGFVGSITWLSEGRALAVGGDGCYPRREEPCPDGLTPAGGDPAGGARAWLFEEGEWRELEPPAGMRGLTAVAASPRKADCGKATGFECAAAGGLRQVWTFTDGEFRQGWSGDGSTEAAVERAEVFLFRVRDLAFAPNPRASLPPQYVLPPPDPGEGTYAVAVTGGCCASDPALNGPRALVFDGLTWHVRQLHGLNAADGFAAESERRPLGDQLDNAERNWDAPGGRQRIERGCATVPFVPCAQDLYEEGYTLLGITLVPPLEPGTGEPWPVDLPDDLPRPPGEEVVDPAYQGALSDLDEATTPYGANVQLPDSYYGLWAIVGDGGNGNMGTGAQFRVVAAPGGPAPAAVAEGVAANEPASHVADARTSREREGGSFSLTLGPSQQERFFSSVRLVSGDQTPVGVANCCGLAAPPSEPDPKFFEAVGLLRSTGQGVAFGPWERDPNRGHAPLHGCDTANDGTPVFPPENCDPDAERFAAAFGSMRLFKLDSYALNAVDVLDDEFDNGAGWAVGDFGAIHSLGGRTAAQAQLLEPAPPVLGARRQGKLPDTAAYEAFRQPLTSEPGTVPPLGATPELEHFRAPRYVAAGDGLTEIAMSRDGSEGWGIDPQSDTVARLSGTAWHTCRRGTTADAACPELGPLAAGDIAVEALVRVPLERDDEPANDDELELLAFSEGKALVYRHGRWRYDDGSLGEGIPAGVSSAVFIAPDDGWAVTNDARQATVYRFAGQGWTECEVPFGGSMPEECADPEGRLELHVEQNGIAGGTAGDGLSLTSAGDRVYLYGPGRVPASAANNTGIDPVYPLIIYRDPGDSWKGSADGSDGGWDPGFYAEGGDEEPLFTAPDTGNPNVNSLLGTAEHYLNPLGAFALYELERQLGEGEPEGRVYALGVREGEDGEFEGWAAGEFGGKGSEAKAVMLRLEDGRWQPWPRPDASDDYLHFATPRRGLELLALPEPVGAHDAFLLAPVPLAFNALRDRWEVLELPFQTRRGKRPLTGTHWTGSVRAIAPDARGGLWVSGEALYRYGTAAPRPVFREVPSPVPPGRAVTASTGAGDGSFWLGTDSNVLYRYDREVGWDSVAIPGWDAGRVVTNPSGVDALAFGPDGTGVAVGRGGRIAEVGPKGGRLDRAAGTACDLGAPAPPCGTGRDLTAAAVAADGSAMVAGEGLASLLWRPAGGEFRVIEPPPRQPAGAVYRGLFMPSPDSAFATLSTGRLFRGEREGEGWRWQPEPSEGVVASGGASDYAVVGSRVLRRLSDGEWRPVELDTAQVSSVAAPVGGGPGVVVGSNNGQIMTLQRGALRVARPADPFAPLDGSKYGSHSVTSLAVVPGAKPDGVEAWAVAQDTGGRYGYERNAPAHVLLHYASDPSLDPAPAIEPLPDAPAPRDGEITIAAFGKQDCQRPELDCFEQSGRRTHAEVARRVIEEIGARAERSTGPLFALHTGDTVDSPAPERISPGAFTFSTTVQTPANRDRKVARWVEHTADRLTDSGLPVFGALGRHDLTTTQTELCPGPYGCVADRGAATWFWSGFHIRSTGNGTNVQWRRATAIAPAPWERPEGIEDGSLRFERVDDGLFVRAPEAAVEDPRGGGTLAVRPSQGVTARTGSEGVPELRAEAQRGGVTHYAVDVIDESQDDRKLARIVVLDTSLRSLRASDGAGEPQRAGGQLAWLERMVCLDGGVDDTGTPARDCTRDEDQQAIVLSNTPTYTYAPIDPSELQQDAAELETVLIRHRVNLVVSGRLGWMGRYWALAPGVHEPCPGEGYRDTPPDSSGRLCGEGAEAGQVTDATGELSASLEGAGAPPTPAPDELLEQAGDAAWPLPFVVSSTAGGEFAPAGQQGGAGPEQGFWRGHAIARLDPSGDPRKTIVEMRPAFDWIAIRAQERTLKPGQRMTIRGYGRETYGQETAPRRIDINSPAISHRYDLLLADPERPKLPLRDANGDYVPLPSQVATIDRHSGELRTGRGTDRRTYAVALLSVGDKTASYPLAFEPRRSFLSARAKLQLPPLARPARAPAAQPPLRVAEPVPPPPPPPPAGPSSPLATQTLQPPQPPQLPSLPALNPAPPPAAPTLAAPPPPPPPPAPPTIPPQQQPQPLALNAKLQPVSLVPSVNPPAPPPVNPAPPAGSAARKEAKQRQAATAKSEETAREGAGDGIDVGHGDHELGTDGSAMTRVEHPFTRARAAPQPSAWSRAAYGGGLGLAAAALALTFAVLRPRGGRRRPELPAPAIVSAARRHRR